MDCIDNIIPFIYNIVAMTENLPPLEPPARLPVITPTVHPPPIIPETDLPTGHIVISEHIINPETPPQPPVEITVTHHLPDSDPKQSEWLSLENGGGFETKSKELKDMGFTKHRFDARWNKLIPKKPKGNSGIDAAYLKRIADVHEIGNRVGLDSIVVLSSAPKWALKLAKRHPDQFAEAYTSYIDTVFQALKERGGNPPSAIQIFNELNMSNYTPHELLGVIPQCIDIVNQKSLDYFGLHIPLVATLQVSSPVTLKSIPGFMKGASPFITNNQLLLEKFDEIKLDYYPGIWHQPKNVMRKYLANAGYFLKALIYRNKPGKIASLDRDHDLFTSAFQNMNLLEDVLAQLKPLQDKGKQIGIGEIGTPSIVPFDTKASRPDHERLQTLGTATVVRNLRTLVKKFDLKEIGLYSLMDESKPELGVFNWGLYRKDGVPKDVVKQIPLILSQIRSHQPITPETPS
jgi:hypothetical protein